MKRLLFGGILVIALLALIGAKPRAIAIDPPIVIAQAAPLSIKPTPDQVAAYVISQCRKAGVNPVDCSWIVSHESQDGRNMRGDDGQSRGYWMISSVYHPEVSDSCADDLHCSTAWSINWILKGHINQWSTWLYRFKWFGAQNPPL